MKKKKKPYEKPYDKVQKVLQGVVGQRTMQKSRDVLGSGDTRKFEAPNIVGRVEDPRIVGEFRRKKL